MSEECQWPDHPNNIKCLTRHIPPPLFMSNNKTIDEIFVNFRIKCDVAVSERDDGFYTQKQYEESIQWELDQATKAIQALITEARIDEQTNTGGDLDGSVYFRTKKGWSSQEDRLAELKKRGSDE